MRMRTWLVLSVALAAALSAATLPAQDILVTDLVTGAVGDYTLSGSTVNPSLFSTGGELIGIAVSGSNVYVANYSAGKIGLYTTSGATLNASLITGLVRPAGLV